MAGATALPWPTVEPRLSTVDNEGRRLRVLLVCMPWIGLHLPSLALSTLAPLGRSSPYVEQLDVRYANIEWADHVFARSDGRLNSLEYLKISESDMSAIGEWIFCGALYNQSAPELTPYHASVSATGFDLSAATELYSMAPDFVERLADDIAGAGYDMVGFTTTFVQNVPSLALAQAVKKRSPEVTIVFGGANCDDEQGAALHRNFPFVDYVVRGEAETAFPLLLRLLGGDRQVKADSISGLCWWGESGPVANPMPGTGGLSVDVIPEPTYEEYFAAFDRARVCADVRPRIVLEGARGCWWGQKHHCTFCGLNDNLMAFRAKEPDRIFGEIQRAVRRYRVLDLMFADNILDQRYIRDLLPRLGQLGWDLQIFFEVKANQPYPQLERMAQGGVAHVQPGIESFSTPVLKLMRKGITGWQNVRFLRDCRTLGVNPMWNLLYGFPGETEADYLPMVEQLPNLIHLKPPQGAARVSLTRFSPFFEDPSLGMVNLGPARMYRDIYDLPADEIGDLVYLFSSPESGITGALVRRLEAAVEHWLVDNRGRSLVAFASPGSVLVLVDERQPGQTIEYTLPAPAAAVYRALLKGRGVVALLGMMADDPVAPPPTEIRDLLDAWYEAGLVFRDGDTYVALATGLAYQ